ncbi:unnamed protein product [Rhizoctonia solani]|uniref:Uncharacterized protein n=1 Tax=Rhizoctonia solani TaxID=456999 RepID=A0A8H2WHW9_9AGAM|nr:unnamed protein product [Rhizoctonia solani]
MDPTRQTFFLSVYSFQTPSLNLWARTWVITPRSKVPGCLLDIPSLRLSYVYDSLIATRSTTTSPKEVGTSQDA